MTTVDECKAAGNAAMAEADFVNAMKWYSQALALDPKKDGALYSNRSFAFLRLNLTSRALADAEEAVRRRPDWPKAHFRRAEALAQGDLHAEALQSYVYGSRLDPTDEHLRRQCEQARQRDEEQRRGEKLLVAGGVGAGLLLLLLLVASGGGGEGGLIFRGMGALLTAALGGGGGAAAALLRRHQRRGAVLPPLQSNEQFAALQMKDDVGGAGPLRQAKGGKDAARRDGAAAPSPPVAGCVPTAAPDTPGEGSGKKARVRSTGNGRAAALKALGKTA